MNKIFHEKVSFSKIAMLLLVLFLLFVLAWQKSWLAIPILILAIGCLERFLHCTYTITADGKLEIYKGRFGKTQVLSLLEMDRVEYNHYTFNLGIKLGSYLLVVMKDGRQIGIRPEREQEFISYIEHKQTQIAQQKLQNEED